VTIPPFPKGKGLLVTLRMKIIETKQFKLAKNKYPKNEMTPYNPFAVCTESTGREDKEKYERCIQSLKKQNRKRNKKKD